MSILNIFTRLFHRQVGNDLSVAANIERGIRALDKVYGPRWPFEIDLETLNLSDAHQCVLGQIVKGRLVGAELSPQSRIDPYRIGLTRILTLDAEEAKQLVGAYDRIGLSAAMAFHIGLDPSFEDWRTRDRRWTELTDAWIGKIDALRSERGDRVPHG